VLGQLREFRLASTGTVTDQDFHLAGAVEDRPDLTIWIDLKKIGELVAH
jgi:hypothetical protein